MAREIWTALRGYNERACACADSPCAGQVQLDQAKWLLENSPRFKTVKSTSIQTKAANALATATEACVKKLVDAKPKK